MTFRAMEIFQAVAERESMQSAAQALFISVPSVSEVISDLEKEYNQRLFERLNRRLYITPAGQQLYDYVTRIMNLQREMQQQMHSSNAIHVLRIGSTVSIGSSVIFPILEQAGLINAAVTINNTRSIEEKLLKNELDIALVEGSVLSGYLRAEDVLEDELVLACSRSHPFAGGESVSWKELEDCPLLLREEGSGTREKLMEAFERMGAKPNIRWESSCFNSLLKAAAAGMGVTVISSRLVPPELAAIRVNGFDGKRIFRLVWHKDKYFTESLRSFVSACRKFSGRTDV